MRQVSIEFSVRHLQVAAQRTLAAATSPLVARMNRNGMDPGADLAGGVVGGFVVAVGVVLVLVLDLGVETVTIEVPLLFAPDGSGIALV